MFQECKMISKYLTHPCTHLTHPSPLSHSRFGRMQWVLRHRDAEKSVAPTDFSVPLCRDTFLPCLCRVAACRLCRLRVGRICSILHLTLTRCNSLIVSTLFSVRYYQLHLHTTYTPHTLPHGTSTGGRCHGIGEQKSLLLRQIFLRPYGVRPTAYVQIGCLAAGCGV